MNEQSPKKVKAYGLIWFTKKQYIITQACVFALLALLLVWSVLGDLNALLFGYGNTILAVVIVAEAIETMVMLRAFGKQ